MLRFVDATKYVSDVSNRDSFLPIESHGVWIEFTSLCFPPNTASYHSDGYMTLLHLFYLNIAKEIARAWDSGLEN